MGLSYPLSASDDGSLRSVERSAGPRSDARRPSWRRVGPGDIRIAPATLQPQADFAEQGRANPQLAENLRRGAELVAFADDELLEFYEPLRPGRSTPAELDALAARLDERGAAACAALVREARGAYVRRGLA